MEHTTALLERKIHAVGQGTLQSKSTHSASLAVQMGHCSKLLIIYLQQQQKKKYYQELTFTWYLNI